MANFLLGYLNAVPGSTVTASAEEAALPATNVQTDQGSPAEAWQCPAISGSLQLLFPALVSLRVISLHRTNLTSSATWRVRAWQTADVSASPAVDTGTVSAGVVPFYGQALLVLPAEVPTRTVRVEIADAANPDGFLNVPLMFAGPCWQPRRNYGYASSISNDDSTTVTTTRSGAEIVRNDWVRRGFDIVLGAVAPNEVPLVKDIDVRCRRGGNLLLVPNPDGDPGASAVFGRCKPSASIGYANNSARTRTWRATLTERL